MGPEFSLDADGGLCRDGSVFVPAGVNYRPVDGATLEQVRADLAAVAALGLNAVRLTGFVPGLEANAVVRLARASGLAVAWAVDGGVPPPDILPLAEFASVRFSARPGTHVLGCDGLADPFFHSFLPFTIRAAQLRRRVVVSALGVGTVLDAAREAAWLHATLPAARVAGAEGFFWSEWRGPDGLIDDDGNVRSGRTAFVEFAAHVCPAENVSETSPVDLIVPADGRFDGACAGRLLLAHYFLGMTGRAVRLRTTAAAGRTALIAGVPLAPTDVTALHSWVAGGGELFWHGPDPLAWDGTLAALLGARPVDWRSGRGISVQAFGERFTLAHFPQGVRAELEPTTATVVAADHQGFPLLLENRVGQGRVRYALPWVEEAVVPVAAHPASRDRWVSWYRGLLET